MNQNNNATKVKLLTIKEAAHLVDGLVQYLSFISIVFDYAIKMGMLSDNPCRRVTVPKGEKKEKQVYTLEEIEQFFALLETAPLKYQLFFTLLIYSRFRCGDAYVKHGKNFFV